MSIRYASGTYTTPLDLLNALDTYLVSTLGWTRNMTPTLIAGKTAGYRAHYQKTIAKSQAIWSPGFEMPEKCFRKIHGREHAPPRT